MSGSVARPRPRIALGLHIGALLLLAGLVMAGVAFGLRATVAAEALIVFALLFPVLAGYLALLLRRGVGHDGGRWDPPRLLPWRQVARGLEEVVPDASWVDVGEGVGGAVLSALLWLAVAAGGLAILVAVLWLTAKAFLVLAMGSLLLAHGVARFLLRAALRHGPRCVGRWWPTLGYAAWHGAILAGTLTAAFAFGDGALQAVGQALAHPSAGDAMAGP